MHKQDIIDVILKKLDTENCNVKCISLIADENNLRNRLFVDAKRGIRTVDSIEKSISRIPLYRSLNTFKIDTSNKTVSMISNEIIRL